MTKHLKKALALLLAIALCLGTIPFTAFAAEVQPDNITSSETIIEPEKPEITPSPEPDESASPRGSPEPTDKEGTPSPSPAAAASPSAEPTAEPDNTKLSLGTELDVDRVWPAVRRARARVAATFGTSGTLYVGDYCFPGGVGTPPTLGEYIGPMPIETMRYGSNNVAAYCIEHARFVP